MRDWEKAVENYSFHHQFSKKRSLWVVRVCCWVCCKYGGICCSLWRGIEVDALVRSAELWKNSFRIQFPCWYKPVVLCVRLSDDWRSQEVLGWNSAAAYSDSVDMRARECENRGNWIHNNARLFMVKKNPKDTHDDWYLDANPVRIILEMEFTTSTNNSLYFFFVSRSFLSLCCFLINNEEIFKSSQKLLSIEWKIDALLRK